MAASIDGDRRRWPGESFQNSLGEGVGHVGVLLGGDAQNRDVGESLPAAGVADPGVATGVGPLEHDHAADVGIELACCHRCPSAAGVP